MNNKIRNIVRSILKEEFDYSAEEIEFFDKQDLENNNPKLEFDKEEPWLVSMRIKDKSMARNYDYISSLIKDIIKERNVENYPVTISWTTQSEADFKDGMEKIKKLMENSHEVMYINYNPANVKYTKVFNISVQMDNYSPEHYNAMKSFGGLD